MNSLVRRWMVALTILVGIAGDSGAQQREDEAARYVTPEDMPVFVLDVAEAFKSLDERERMYAHWMSQASWIGAQITAAQVSYESPAILDLLELVFSTDRIALRQATTRAGIGDREFAWLEQYAARCFSNLGNYLAFGDTKFVPRIPPEKFELVVRAADGIRGGNTRMPGLWAELSRKIYSLSPEERQLGLGRNGTSAYYSENMTEEEVKLVNDFLVSKKISPYNTRVEKNDLGFVVKTASAEVGGRSEASWSKYRIVVENGDFSSQMKDIVACMEKASLYAANDHQRAMIEKYIEHFRTGNIDAHKDAMRHWVKDTGPVVETNLGFIESYRDPAGVRGEWEGLVAVVNKEQTRKFGVLVEKAPAFIAKLPWGPTFEKEKYHRPDFTSLDVLTFANCDIPAGINIPNYDDIRQNEGFKNVSLGNVLSARKPGKDKVPFIADADQDLFKTLMGPAFEVQVGLHELLGHGSGRLFNEVEAGKFDFVREETVDPGSGKPVASWYRPGETWNSKFGGLAQTYEECRAEAVGLYLSTETDVLAIFGHVDQEAKDVTYVNWLLMARAGIDGLRYYNPSTGEWGQAHMQARFALLNVMRRAGDGLVKIVGDGEHRHVELDREKIASVGRRAVGDFLTRLMVYKATGDFEGGKALYDDFTKVTAEDLELRELVFKKAKPRNVWVQPVTDVDDRGQVFLREYPATHAGVIDSYLDRFTFISR